MKRIRTSLTALAVTSALALGGLPAAHAEEYNWDLGTPPATVSVAGVDYDYKDGEYVERGGTKTMSVDEAKAATSGQTPAAPTEEYHWDLGMPPATVTVDGVAYDYKDGKYVERGGTKTMTVEEAKAATSGQAPAAPTSKAPSSSVDINDDLKAGIGTALAAAIVIGGITWYLNQDGKTYVSSKDRVNQVPTAEEKAASEKMLAENADAVAEQSKAAQNKGTQSKGTEASQSGQRGMLAQTGSNTAARGLFALLVMSILGSLAFIARRKFAA